MRCAAPATGRRCRAWMRLRRSSAPRLGPCAPSTSAPRSSRPTCSTGSRPLPTAHTRGHPPGSPAGPGPQVGRAAGGGRGPAAGHRGGAAERRERGGDSGVHRGGRARHGADLRLRRAARGAAALRPRVSQRAPLAAAPLARRCSIERAIEAGDEDTGVTIMRPTAELDAGPMCLQRPEPIGPEDDYGTVAPRLAALGAELLVEALDLHPPFRDEAFGRDHLRREGRAGGPAARPGPPGSAARAARPGAHAAHRRLHRVALGRPPGCGARSAVPDQGPAPGRLEVHDGSLLYGAATGALDVLEVHPAG